MNPDHRVLLRLATSKDDAMTIEALARGGVEAQACTDIAHLVQEMAVGAGMLMVAEEALGERQQRELHAALAAQPPWSDIPMLVLARQGVNSPAVDAAIELLPNVTIIERPVRVASLVSAVRSTLRARRRQYELRGVLDGLREADQRKTQFLATLAHELRNPLAPISTGLALLMRREPERRAEALRVYRLMRRQVDHMVRLVDDLMEVSRITRGKVVLQRRRVGLHGAIRDATELSRPLIDQAGHTLTVELPPDVLTVRGDAVRLTQVFSNLLNNAAKYTPPGGSVRIAARRDGADVLVEVSDTGAGLTPQMLEPIFDMFVQVGDSAKRAQGGLGIGLTLVKSLVELHGGRVHAASDGPGRGSTFTVRLPLVDEPSTGGDDVAADAMVSRQLLVPRHVLVVDDNHDAADSLADLLRAMGAAVDVVYSADDALRLVDHIGADELDAAVLDIGMPQKDGCTLARELRTRPGGDALKLIALTGWGQDRDRERIASAGFDHHVLKPVDAGVLRELLN